MKACNDSVNFNLASQFHGLVRYTYTNRDWIYKSNSLTL